MNYYVYIIQSISTEKFNKGFSLNPTKILQQHNEGLSRYTKNFRPWKLVHLEIFNSKTEALIREKKLKKYSKEQINDLMASPKNRLIQYMPPIPN